MKVAADPAPRDVEPSRWTRLPGPRWTIAIAIVGATLGAALLPISVGALREAHLYRQRTGEGLQFAVVVVGFAVVNALWGAAALAAARVSWIAESERTRQAFTVATGVLVTALVATDALALWVAWHVDRCVGACG